MRPRRAGIFRATRLRVNPRQRAVHALFKTYLDVVHVARADEGKMFTGAAAAKCVCDMPGVFGGGVGCVAAVGSGWGGPVLGFK